VIAAVEIPARFAGSFRHRSPKEMTMSAKSTKATKRMPPALLALLLTATASAAQAAPHRSHHAARAQTPGTAWSARPSYPNDDVPWTFACIKDHGTSRCNDLN
jgi:hypothetical protein